MVTTQTQIFQTKFHMHYVQGRSMRPVVTVCYTTAHILTLVTTVWRGHDALHMTQVTCVLQNFRRSEGIHYKVPSEFFIPLFYTLNMSPKILNKDFERNKHSMSQICTSMQDHSVFRLYNKAVIIMYNYNVTLMF